MKSISSLLILMALLLGSISGSAMAGEPTNVIKDNTDHVLSYIKSTEWKSATQDERRKKILSVIEGVFDEKVFSKRVLGRSWDILSSSQKEEFVILFARLQEINLSEMIKEYLDNEIIYLDESIREDRSFVRTKIISPSLGDETLVDYRLHMTPDGWKIYEINVDGISLSQNYQAQLKSILDSSKPEILLDRLRDKVRSAEQGVKE